MLQRIQRFTTVLSVITVTAIAILAGGCSVEPGDVIGTYRGAIETGGGDVAFPLHINRERDSLTAFVVNGADTMEFTSVEIDGDSLHLSFDYYDSNLHAVVQANGDLEGRWTRRSTGGRYSQLPFRADKGVTYRYEQTSPDKMLFDGKWKTTFKHDGETSPAVGVFVTQPGGIIHGSFARQTGDYRFLEGTYTDSTFTMSTFDGAHVFLFKGRLQRDGTIEGDFWSKDGYHATWTAEPGADDVLANPMQLSAEQAIGRKMEFAFRNLEGDTVRASSPRYQGNPMLVYIFGSWCPNCADEADLIRDYYREYYSETDLKVVGLAFEFTGDFQKDAEMVSRYKNRFDIPWDLLIAGSTTRDNAADVLPFMDKIVSYPTSIFVDSTHTIKYIHTGFNGPATGSYYFKEKQRFKEHLDAITQTPQ